MDNDADDRAAVLLGCTDMLPQFCETLRKWKNFDIRAGLSPEEIAALEQRLDFSLDDELKQLLSRFSGLSFPGFFLDASNFNLVRLPETEGLLLAEFQMYSPGDRVLMLRGDESVYYMEQRNGSFIVLSGSLTSFFEKKLTRHLNMGRA